MLVNREDKQWVASLTNNRAGRLLANHLASMELCDQADGRDCAVTEAVANERVFVYAIARAVYQSRPYPFGLSAALPRFIAVLNLSGERMMVYSDNPALLRCLCSRSSVLMPAELSKALREFEDWGSTPSTDGGAQFVLITYSLPWQSGTNTAFWHLSACGIEATGEKRTEMHMADRLLQFSSGSPESSKGRSVLHPRDSKLTCYLPSAGALELVSDKQIKHLTESYSATCLDFEQAPSVKMDGGSGVEACLRSTLHDLQRGRKEDQAKVRKLTADLKLSQELVDELGEQMQDRVDILTRQHKEAADELKKLYEEKLEVAQQKHSELNAQLESEGRSHKDAAAKHKRAAKEHEARKAQLEELERKCTAKDQLNNAALSQHIATISQLEGRLAKSQEQLKTIRAELEKERCALITKVQREHEEALAKATLALESKKRIINQLSENNERRDVEVASLKTHEEEQARRISDLEAEVQQCSKKITERPVRTKSSGPRKNASTSTHHCASTQTDPPEEATPAAAEFEGGGGGGGKKAVVVAQPLPIPPSYQTALDVLQELVNASGQGHAPRVMPQPMNGNPRPLPFPHFTPNMPYHALDPNGYAYGHPRPYQPLPQQLQQMQQRPVTAYVQPPNFQPVSY